MIHPLPSGCSYVPISKCGSQSMRAALGIKKGDKYTPDGQLKIQGVTPIPFDGTKYVAIVRDPLDRFVSGVHWLNKNYNLNYCYGTWMGMYGKYPRERMQNHVRPMMDFIQDPSKFHKLYWLHEMDKFFADHGLGPVRHENKRTYEKMPVTQDVIDWVHSTFQEDYAMLEDLQKNTEAQTS